MHTPIQAPDDAIARYTEKSGADGQSHPVYAAMIDRVDAGVGPPDRGAGTKLGIADETLIVLTSDNGGHGAYTAMPDLRGEKGTIFEGGIRVPLLIRMPDGAGAGRIEATPTNAVDLYPTLLDAAGVKPAAGHIPDGQSLWALLEAERTPSLRRPLFWHFPAYLRGIRRGQDFRTTPVGAIRDGDFKLIEFFEFGQLELYDLMLDPSESRNLVLHEPAIAYCLYKQMKGLARANVGTRPRRTKSGLRRGQCPAGLRDDRGRRPRPGGWQHAPGCCLGSACRRGSRFAAFAM